MKNLLWLVFLPIFAATDISINVLDATIKDKRVANAVVILQQPSEKSLQTKTNADGKAIITLSEPVKTENTMLIIK
ncbi:MAG: hypothetical protein LBP40_08685, partial [Campylobacteraceae bacterium]|nr:hypothetical protein [Campylobacteraceae bacterium]